MLDELAEICEPGENYHPQNLQVGGQELARLVRGLELDFVQHSQPMHTELRT